MDPYLKLRNLVEARLREAGVSEVEAAAIGAEWEASIADAVAGARGHLDTTVSELGVAARECGESGERSLPPLFTEPTS